MKRLPATIRLALGLLLLSVSTVLCLRSFGIFPNEHHARLESRRQFCEVLSIHTSLLVSRNDIDALRESLKIITERYPDIIAIRLRKADGSIPVEVGSAGGRSEAADTTYSVALLAPEGRWGDLEVAYAPLIPAGVSAIVAHPFGQFMIWFICVSALLFVLYLKRTLQHLDPSKVVPDRVRHALDTIPGGLVILDDRERILLANKSFAEKLRVIPADVVGRRLSQFPWRNEAGESLRDNCPWNMSVQEGVPCNESRITITSDDETRFYRVQSSPIVADDSSHRGALVSFDDVTDLESQRTDLARALNVLRTSRDQVRRQNEELQRLATRDPLTDCLNRRAFYQGLEIQWKTCRQNDQPLSCMMVDVDHFKSINDNHGHSMGDEVLQSVARTIKENVREIDLVCRFGGEEFCVLLPQLTSDQAVGAAEEVRRALESLELPNLKVTASLGVACNGPNTDDMQQMIDQADQSLYVAKRNGRNQVVQWDADTELAQPEPEVDTSRGLSSSEVDSPQPEIPYHAVSALISALSFRHADTAEHCRRVADLCLVASSGLMNARDSYVLEIAGLLHDIGKIGVPDSILLKPGPLTAEEWRVMSVHDRIGVEIIDSAFSCQALTEIVGTHHAWYGGHPREPNLPTGEQIPLGARILSIADAYDAMVSDRVYRAGRSPQEAFDELRRCSGTQFDKRLVEKFIAAVTSSYENRRRDQQPMTRPGAVILGQHIEKLATTIDNQDLHGLAALAGRLCEAATQHQATDLAAAAEELKEAVADGADLSDLIELTTDVMELCRTTQSAFLESHPLVTERQSTPLGSHCDQPG